MGKKNIFSVLFSRDRVAGFKAQKDKPGGNQNYMSYLYHTDEPARRAKAKSKSKSKAKSKLAYSSKLEPADETVDTRKRKATASARRAIKGF